MINVIGLGYIGLPTALMLAAHGVEVVGTDYNAELVATLNAGKTTFKEKGLDELFADAIKGGIKFTTEYQVTDTYVVSVPTPYDKFTKKVDACYVVAAMKSVMAVCPKGATVVIESTVSPGTIDKYVRPAVEANGFKIGEDIHLVHAPERIIPGNMIYELLHNNRTIGADDKVVGEKIKALYSSFCLGEIVVTDIRTAEMTKVVENTFRLSILPSRTSWRRSAAMTTWMCMRSFTSATCIPALTSCSRVLASAAIASASIRGSWSVTIRVLPRLLMSPCPV